MNEQIMFMVIFWALMMLTIVITNQNIGNNVKENVKEVIIKTKDKEEPMGVEIVTDEMERDMEEGAKNEYYKTRY